MSNYFNKLARQLPSLKNASTGEDWSSWTEHLAPPNWEQYWLSPPVTWNAVDEQWEGSDSLMLSVPVGETWNVGFRPVEIAVIYERDPVPVDLAQITVISDGSPTHDIVPVQFMESGVPIALDWTENENIDILNFGGLGTTDFVIKHVYFK